MISMIILYDTNCCSSYTNIFGFLIIICISIFSITRTHTARIFESSTTDHV